MILINLFFKKTLPFLFILRLLINYFKNVSKLLNKQYCHYLKNNNNIKK